MSRLVVTVSGTGGPPGISPRNFVSAIDANNNLTINGVPTLLIHATNLVYSAWLTGSYSEAQADAMIQQAVNSGANATSARGSLYPYSTPQYIGQLTAQVLNTKFGLYINQSSSLDGPTEAAIIQTFKTIPGLLMWGYSSEPDMSLYADDLPKYQLAGQVDLPHPVNCTQAIRAGTTHNYAQMYDTTVFDGGWWDEEVNANGLHVPIVEFVANGSNNLFTKLWEYLIFMDRRVRGVTQSYPSVAATAADGGAGVMTGTYTFVHTWVTALNYKVPGGIETYASPPSSPITVSGRQVTVGVSNGPAGTMGKNVYAYKNGVQFVITGTLFSGSNVVTGIVSTSGLISGMTLSGSNIPSLTYIKSVDSATQIKMTQNATGSGSVTITASPSPGSFPTSGYNLVAVIQNNTATAVTVNLDYPFLKQGSPPPKVTQLGWIPSISSTIFSELGGYPPVSAAGVTLDYWSRWFWIQVAFNCRAFDIYSAIRLGTTDPIVGPLTQNTQINFVSDTIGDTRTCTIEGLLADGVTIAREDNIVLNGTTPVASTNTYSLVKWVAVHTSHTTARITCTQVTGGQNILIDSPYIGGTPSLTIPPGGANTIYAGGNDGWPNGYLTGWNNAWTIVHRIRLFEAQITAPGLWVRNNSTVPAYSPMDDAGSAQSKGLYVAQKTVAGILYVIAINVDITDGTYVDNALTNATINVGQTINTCTRLFDGGSPSFAGSTITESFNPAQVYVYAIT